MKRGDKGGRRAREDSNLAPAVAPEQQGENSEDDIRGHADEWIEEYRGVVDAWLDEARKAGA